MPDFKEGPGNLKIVDIKKARENLAAKTPKSEEDPEFLLNVGLLFYGKNQFSKAIDAFTKALEVNPQYALAWFDLGNIYSDLKRRKRAIECYEKSIKFDPNYADAYYNLALWQEASNPFSAISNFNKYLEFNISGDEREEVLVKIAKLEAKIKKKS